MMKTQILNTNILFTISLILFSCSKTEASSIPQPEPYAAQPVTAPVEAEGNDCLSCYTIDSKLTGSSYQEVAAKYTEADLNILSKKSLMEAKAVGEKF